MRQGVLNATFPLSGTITGDLDLRGGRLQAIYVPVITSGDLFIRGSFNTTSANFGRIQSPVFGAPTSGDLRIATGAGSCMVLWPDNLPSPSYIRLETSVAQAAVASLAVRFGRN